LSRRWRRSTFALALAVAALVGAAAAALGPSNRLQTHYSWPPQHLPAVQPDRLWYTPLLLSRHEPESISAELPCNLPRALPHSTRPLTVVATAPDWKNSGGLAVTRSEHDLRLHVGSDTLATIPVGGGVSLDTACAYHLFVGDGRWSLREADVSREGGLEQMPTVVGLFSGVDLRSGAAPSITVTTHVYGSHGRRWQTALWAVAALAALCALVLVGVVPRPRRSAAAVRGSLRRVASCAGPVDAVVAILLGGWWLIGPSYFDDGWRMASQTNFPAFHQFSSYYSSFGVGASLDWLQWTEHVLFQGSRALLVVRLPALLCLAATWVLCRWILSRVVPSSAGGSRLGVWTLASGFAVGALAWGMTFRPEPVVALLVTGVLACTILFVEREAVGPIVVAALLVGLAVLAHPAGIVALAPLLATAPRLGRWARPRLATATTIVVATLALVGILVVLGSDIHQRREDLTTLRTSGDEGSGWRDELTRYSLLSRVLYGAPLRREWVALALLAVVAYVLRRRPDRPQQLPGLPAASMGIGLLLLIATPSKLPWHFGALIGLAAVAVAAETLRLREDGRRSDGWQVRPFIVVGAAMLAAAWSWFPRNAWADLDLRTLQWTLGIEQKVTFAKVAGLLPLAVLVGLALFELRRRQGRRMDDVPWRAASLTAPVLAVPLIAFTAAVLVADSAKTHSWTLARQNIDTLTGGLRCGLADDAVVPVRASMRALVPVGSAQLPPAAPWLPRTPAEGLARLALGAPPARSPWFRLPHGQRMGFFLTGIPGSSDSLELEWGRMQRGRVERMGSAGVTSVLTDDARPDIVYWRFYAAGDLPTPPPGAGAVRFALRTELGPGAAIGLTAPVTYEDEPLVALLERNVPSLALPNLLTYVPCVKQPRVGGGAEVPKVILAFRDTMWPLGTGTSPFDELPELYPLVRLPLSDSQDPPADVAVYDVDRRIGGAAIAPPLVSGA
jgi:Mycobacterial cell wall arabinan synthesis protein